MRLLEEELKGGRIGLHERLEELIVMIPEWMARLRPPQRPLTHREIQRQLLLWVVIMTAGLLLWLLASWLGSGHARNP